MAKHTNQTGSAKRIDLSSSIQQVQWARRISTPGATVGLDVQTLFVGNSAKYELELSDHSGRKHGTEKGALSGNRLSMEIMVPDAARDALYAEFKLPKHGLKQRSPPLLLKLLRLPSGSIAPTATTFS